MSNPWPLICCMNTTDLSMVAASGVWLSVHPDEQKQQINNFRKKLLKNVADGMVHNNVLQMFHSAKQAAVKQNVIASIILKEKNDTTSLPEQSKAKGCFKKNCSEEEKAAFVLSQQSGHRIFCSMSSVSNECMQRRLFNC
ncbi:hypothetical protein PoB_006884800 [Plakobranchus ocellatus]|uniref:Uncharacterized protein n=1 Tax=Plakobranchus ocellatus TaxID=259542 RepID=A0AAV4DDQ0_9GAST|nr:hypothetical protein PoB_006884800 [Plakobranchus ocellatus]